MLEDDRSAWQPWWELHKTRFLAVKQNLWRAGVQTGSDDYFLGSSRRPLARDVLQPTAADVERLVLPALRRAIDSTDQRDIVTACMIAMAKTGGHSPDWGLVADVLVPRLASRDQEVRETAALAIGISGHRDRYGLDLLGALAEDAAAGRRACDRAQVDDRTRAFACYALGVVAGGDADARTRHRAASILVGLVQDQRLSNREVRVAAVVALGLLAAEGRGAGGAAIADLSVAALGDYFERRLGRGEEIVQAHCPPAIARLCRADRALAAHWRERFAAELARTEGRRSAPVSQSCALALGVLGSPTGDGEVADPDPELGQLLLRTWYDHPDAQTRYFAAMALGRIGGDDNRTALLRALPRAGRAIEQPWAALALGVLAYDRRRRGTVDAVIGEQLLQALRRTRNPGTRGAIALAIGLSGWDPAAEDLRAELHDAGDDELRGHLCIALALLGERLSCDSVRAVLRQSLRRPELLRQSAVALSVLGDREVAADLMACLQGDTSVARLSAVASALAWIGDRRTIAPLTEVLDDSGNPALARAFAAAALGGVADRRLLPWNTDLRDSVNYRAAVETLWDGTAGILDIL